ncbi:MAG: prepilin-type N-terminal cleavage/methylation domain-containing protein [Peptoniphilaceae bacterium]
MNKKLKAFTLVELVIVIAIILILVSIAIPRFSKSNLTAQAAAHNVNVKEIKNAAIMYLIENPENKSDISINDLKDYFEGNIPKPAKALKDGENDFKIRVDTDGNITVSPGQVKVEGKELKEINSN